MPERDLPDDESVDRLLRRSLGADAPPSLSTDFDRRLRRRLERTRLDRRGRAVLALYAIASLLASVVVLRMEAIGWGLVAAAVLTPILLVAGLWRRQRLRW